MVTAAVDAALLVGAPVALATVTASASAVRYVVADGNKQAAMRCSWRIRLTWKRTALMVGLVQTDQSAKLGEQIPLDGEMRTRTKTPRHVIPRMSITTDSYGVVIRVKTVGRIGLAEWRKAADYLANEWRVRRVQVSQAKPGYLTVRALLRDPLTETYTLPMPKLPVSGGEGLADIVDLKTWILGRSQIGTDVTVRSSNVSGFVASGLSGYGKSTLLSNRVCRLAVSPCVQFVLIDGKGGADWDDFEPRCWRFCKDDKKTAHAYLGEVVELMNRRHALIRAWLGVKNMWKVGPSKTWPLLLVVIDEAHTFFYSTKGDKDAERLANETTRFVEELIRKGRDVGIQVILATQKPTGDAIPTQLRDNCQIAISFAQRTSEAAVAALGGDIADYPDAHPRRLLDPAYVGVATLVAEGRPGFTLVRTPAESDDDQLAIIAEATAHLMCDPLITLPELHEAADLIDAGMFEDSAA
jgi:DNA segregation ATPase FtsK/SpoIIIE, S-DNA-T family